MHLDRAHRCVLRCARVPRQTAARAGCRRASTAGARIAECASQTSAYHQSNRAVLPGEDLLATKQVCPSRPYRGARFAKNIVQRKAPLLAAPRLLETLERFEKPR